MDQSFLKRLWLLEHMDTILKEAKYHRDFDAEEDLDGEVIYVDTKSG